MDSAQIAELCRVVEMHSGIRLGRDKIDMVRVRLKRRLRELELPDVAHYTNHMMRDASEVHELVDAMTTNVTSFFREARHFRYLAAQLRSAPPGAWTVWSAGCSSGEEPYSLAMVLDRYGREGRVLGTDISRRMLERAARASYDDETLAKLPAAYRERYMMPQGDGSAVVADSIRARVRLAYLNLLDEWPMRGPFDAIFCRNVMIYFDRPTRQHLFERFASLLRDGGHLFVGHSESFRAPSLRLMVPGVYRR